MSEALYNILIKGGSWLTILDGLRVTVQISALSLLFGTILGAAVCYLRLSDNKILLTSARIYISIVRGSPVLMLLMLLFYGVLAGSGLSPLMVAVVTFSLHTAAHVAELIRASVMALDVGQIEAARTLGFSKIQAFKLIALPQIVRIAKPVYQSTVVNLIQWTSVVGYVTITDLTRVINNTASRTMQPMLTITIGMLIYLLISYAVYGLFALTERKEATVDEHH